MRQLVKAVFDRAVVPSTRLVTSAIIDRAARAPLRYQPTFIIGAPRTGSTILYQALTNAFDVLYIDNLACRWCGNLPFGLWLSELAYGRKPHGNFKSVHGSTSHFGGHAPSECGAFWYRWLPKEHHFVGDSEVTPEMVEGVRREVSAAINLYRRPLVLKNLNAGQRLRLIRRSLPGARFIYVRRNPRRVVDSILRARRANGIGPGAMWSVRPSRFEALLELSEEEMVVAQVAAIEAQIGADLELFPKENIEVVKFEEFSVDMVNRLGNFVGADRRPGGGMPAFKSEPPVGANDYLDSLIDRYFGASPSGHERNEGTI